ncbi:MAG TPA: hypothetical protein ENG56_00655 [Candidatus Aenigmarchaeota archaeon]|nr:hypothetical protein [Candidatus Aenigmarchaeota archaeon]
MKAQAFSLDVIVSILILGLLIISIFYLTNQIVQNSYEQRRKEENVNQALLALRILLEDEEIGIVDQRNLINSTKLQDFLNNCDNESFMSRFGITRNFYFRISDEFYSPLYECGYSVPQKGEGLVHFTRIGLLRNGSEEKIVRVSLVIWV